MRLLKPGLLLVLLLVFAVTPAMSADKTPDKKAAGKKVPEKTTAGAPALPLALANLPVFELPDVIGSRSLLAVQDKPEAGMFLSVRFGGPGGGMLSGERDVLTEKVVSRLKNAGIEVIGRNLPGDINAKVTEIVVDVTGVPAGLGAVFFIRLSVTQPVITISSMAAVGSPAVLLQRAVCWSAGVVVPMEKVSKEMVEKEVLGLAEKYVGAVEKSKK